MTDHQADTADVHEYRARFDAPDGDDDGEVELRAAVDRATRTITCRVPGQPTLTLDLPAARALSMLLRDGVYFSLTPDGPTVRMDCDHGDGRGWIKA